MLRGLFRRKQTPKIPKRYTHLPLGLHLQIACMHNDIEAARELLGLGADPNSREGGEERAIHVAAVHGSPELIDLLLSGGADLLQTINADYESSWVLPSAYARYKGRDDLAAYLKPLEEKRIATIIAAGGKPPEFDAEVTSCETEESACHLEACPRRNRSLTRPPFPPPSA